MSRDLFSGLSNKLDDEVMYPFLAISMEFDTDDLNLWTGYGDLTINSTTYTGTGNLIAVSPVEETSLIQVNGVNVTLTGIPSDVLGLALNEPYQGRKATLYFGVANDTSDLAEIFSGYMDQMNIEEDGGTCTISLSIENKLIDLERPRIRRYTKEDQQSRFEDDKGFNFVEDIQDQPVIWGRREIR